MSTREKLAASALRLFVAKGVAATTTKDIAAATGVAEGTIYRHFASKDELAVDLFARNWLAFATYMERAASRAEGPRDRLFLMMCWLLSAAERQCELFDYLFLVPHNFAAQVARDVQTPVSLLKRELADLVPPGEVELRAAILLGGMREVVCAVRQGRLASPLQAGELLLSSVLLAAPLVMDTSRSEMLA
jgi:AcrR family transcriptional regulator